MPRVRPCHHDDLKAVLNLAEKYASFDSTPTLADIEGLYTNNPEYFLVALGESGNIIGFITGYERKGLPEEVLGNWNASKVGYVDLTAVDMAHRRTGVGTALLESLLSRFKSAGIDLVILDVPKSEVAAVKLYEKVGFRVRAYNMMKPL